MNVPPPHDARITTSSIAGQRRIASQATAPAAARIAQESSPDVAEPIAVPSVHERRWPASSSDDFESRVRRIIAHRAEKLGAHPPEVSLHGIRMPR